MTKTSTDLTQGNIIRQILAFTLPIMLTQTLQNLYNSVDSIVVGNFVGTTALAAVTSSAEISMLIVGFFTGLSTGAGILFSRCFGGRDYGRLHKSIHTALAFAILLGLGMALLGVVFTPFLLQIVDCPADVFAEAVTYLRVYLIGILFTSMYNIGAGVLRAVGDSRTPLYVLCVSSALNIVLDLLFVRSFHMGVLGVALATIISQLVSVALVCRKMTGTDDVYKLTVRDLQIDRGVLIEVMNLGLPSAIQASLTTFSNLFVQGYINRFGSTAMAGIGAARRIDKFLTLIGQSFGFATATFVSQNYGAGDFKRAYKGIRTCFLLNAALITLLGIPVYTFAPAFVRVFTPDPQALIYGVGMMRTILPLYYFMALNSVVSNAVRGFGKSHVVMMLSLVGLVGCRQLWLAISMSLDYNIFNIYIGYPVGWGSAAALVTAYYFAVIKKKYKVTI